MWNDDVVTESPSSGGRAPPVRIERPPLHPQFYAARGVLFGVAFGAEMWAVIAVVVACAVL